MPYNFDEPVNRRKTNSYKWDKFKEDVLPMWVADMDFKSPPEVIEALEKLSTAGLYGYAHEPEELYDVIIKRLNKLHNWKIKKEWIVFLPGLVPGIHVSTRIAGNGFYSVMTSSPVYYPFLQAGAFGERRLHDIPFIEKDGKTSMDFDNMYKKATPDTKAYLLCNPHNPNGRVFTKKELKQLAEFVIEKDLLLMSDEIHCDMILDESKKHISIASLSDEIAERTITLLAPSKTFNVAGLGCSVAIISNPKIREKFNNERFGMMPMVTAFAYESALAAYKYGEPWRKELMDYLRGNHDYLLEEINKIDGLEMKPLEGTYLAWIKFDKKIEDIESYLVDFGLGVSPGTIFNGKQYFRLNIGTQRSNVEKAVSILQKAFIS